MANKADQPQRWYPNEGDFPTHEQWSAHMQTLKTVYDIHDQLQKAVTELDKAKSNIGLLQTTPPAGGATNTQIGGLVLKPTTPTNGQKLTFNASSGQIEWQ